MNRNVVGWASLGCMVCAGCTSLEEIKQKPPVGSYTSSRSISALEGCLSDTLRWIAAPRTTRYDNRARMEFGHPQNIRLAIDLIAGSPTRIEARVSKTYPDQIQNDIKSCLDGTGTSHDEA